jgi:hypothetical protein
MLGEYDLVKRIVGKNHSSFPCPLKSLLFGLSHKRNKVIPFLPLSRKPFSLTIYIGNIAQNVSC